MTKLLVIGCMWPEPASSAAGSRMLQLLDALAGPDTAITFVTTGQKTGHSEDLESRGISCRKIELNHPSFDRFLLDLRPDIVMFDRFMTEEQFGWRVSQNLPQALKLLDTEDLHFLRWCRREALRTGRDEVELRRESDLAKREIAAIYRCDLSLVISEREIEVLVEEFGIPPYLLLYLPFMVAGPSEEQKSELPDFTGRKDLAFIGNFRHAPNADAVLYLRNEVWPEIRKRLPQAELHIFGAYTTDRQRALANRSEGFLIRGRSEEAIRTLRNFRILLAPLRYGAGLKGKFIDAMLAGTPVITTPVGAEGMRWKNEFCGAVSSDPQTMADLACDLYENQESWKRAQQKGFLILEHKFSRQRYSDLLNERVSRIRSELLAHRKANFTGSMLLFHRNNSTRYLSKYIELKNRDK